MPCHLVRIFLLFWTLWYLLLAELLNLLVLVMEVVATEEACVGLEVNWQKAVDRAATKLNRLPSQFVNKLSQWLRTLSTFVILGICQLRVAQTSSNEVPAFMQPWRAVTIGSGCLRQWSWNCTTRVYVRRYCTIWSVVQSPKIARLIPSISGACEDCLASNGINSFEIPKVQLLSGQSLLTLIIQSR